MSSTVSIESLSFYLEEEVMLDFDTEETQVFHPECPWYWVSDSSSNLTYAPREQVAEFGYWNFTFNFVMSDTSTRIAVTSFKINDIDCMSCIVDKVAVNETEYISFCLPSSVILKGLESNGYDLSRIPVSFSIGCTIGGVESTIEMDPTSSIMFLKLDSVNKKLSFTSFNLKVVKNRAWQRYIIPGQEYQDNDAFSTFPSNDINFKFIKSHSDMVKFTFDSIVPFESSDIGKKVPIGTSDGQRFATLQSVNGSTATCSLDLSGMSGSVTLLHSNYMLNLSLDQFAFQFNITPNGQDEVLFYKNGQVAATEFIETESGSDVFLQKGGRVWAKEFVELDIKPLLSASTFLMRSGRSPDWSVFLKRDSQSFKGSIPSSVVMTTIYLTKNTLFTFRNNSIFDWGSYEGLSLVLQFYNSETTHNSLVDLSSKVDFENLMYDVSSGTEYADQVRLLVVNDSSLSFSETVKFSHVIDVYYQEGYSVDLNTIKSRKDGSMLLSELKEV